MKWLGRKAIATDRGQHIAIERSVSRQPPVNVVGDAVIPLKLGEQFQHKARRVADLLDLPLPAQTTKGLRFWVRSVTEPAFQTDFNIRRAGQVATLTSRQLPHHAASDRASFR
jgi:hypothetical protein